MSILNSTKIPLKSSYSTAQALSLFLAITLFLISFIIGRDTLFLHLNINLGPIADTFFNYFTYLAEGWIWIPYLVWVAILHKKEVPFIMINFILSTLLIQLPKNFIWPNVNRPIASGIPLSKIHTVPGVELHTYNSFPSGHTATAFTLLLLTAYLFPNKKLLILASIYAIICGYSRIYLGQHFPIDIAGGIIAALLSVAISIQVRKKINSRPL